jgi:chromosome segregation ATPase
MVLYDEDGNSVEAFTQKEVDAKIAETTKLMEETKSELETKTKELEKLTKLHEDKSTSYSELLKKTKEYEESEKTRREEIESAYAKSIDEQVKKIAGDDKEYAKELKKHLEREGIKEITGDQTAIARQIKEAKALADANLDREPNANPIDGSGDSPVYNPEGRNFTETREGKDTFEALAGMMGLPVEQDNK